MGPWPLGPPPCLRPWCMARTHVACVPGCSPHSGPLQVASPTPTRSRRRVVPGPFLPVLLVLAAGRSANGASPGQPLSGSAGAWAWILAGRCAASHVACARCCLTRSAAQSCVPPFCPRGAEIRAQAPAGPGHWARRRRMRLRSSGDRPFCDGCRCGTRRRPPCACPACGRRWTCSMPAPRTRTRTCRAKTGCGEPASFGAEAAATPVAPQTHSLLTRRPRAPLQ